MFYAIIFDVDFAAATNSVDLIGSGKAIASLRTMRSYDPATDVTNVVRNRFFPAKIYYTQQWRRAAPRAARFAIRPPAGL